MKRNFARFIALFGALALCLSGAAMAVEGTVVDATALRVRAATSTEAEVVGKVYEGQTVEVTGRVGDWYVIDYNGESRYVSAEYIDLGNLEIQNTMGVINESSVNIRTGPGLDYGVAFKLMEGTNVTVTGYENGWFKIRFVDLTGYVRADLLSVDKLVTTSVATNPTNYLVPESNKSVAQKIVDYAYTFLGTPYVYGGKTPAGFDCSGFTMYVFAEFGYDLHRVSTDQYKDGVYVAFDDLEVGDLVFFSSNKKAIGHVGIYIGEGYFIHATSPGDVVRITDISSEYYATRYVGARRIV